MINSLRTVECREKGRDKKKNATQRDWMTRGEPSSQIFMHIYTHVWSFHWISIIWYSVDGLFEYHHHIQIDRNIKHCVGDSWTTFKQAMKRAIKQTTLAITMDSVCIWHQIYSMLIEFDYLRAEMMKRCDGIDDFLFDMRKGTPTKCIHFLVEGSHQKARSNSTWILLWIHSTILKWHVNSYFSEVSFTLPIVSEKPWNSHWKLSKVYLRR